MNARINGSSVSGAARSGRKKKLSLPSMSALNESLRSR